MRRKPRVRIAPIIDGGGHERGMRSGTLNVAGIVGFGKAAEIARTEMAAESATHPCGSATGCGEGSWPSWTCAR